MHLSTLKLRCKQNVLFAYMPPNGTCKPDWFPLQLSTILPFCIAFSYSWEFTNQTKPGWLRKLPYIYIHIFIYNIYIYTHNIYIIYIYIHTYNQAFSQILVLKYGMQLDLLNLHAESGGPRAPRSNDVSSPCSTASKLLEECELTAPVLGYVAKDFLNGISRH